MRELVDRLEDQSLREALSATFGTEYAHVGLRNDLFSAGTENWRMLVADHIRGACLDLYAGNGKRALLLGELADIVYAVDPSTTNLRFLSLRDDYESRSSVVPVRADVASLPFPERSFDTIVATEAIFDRGTARLTVGEAVRTLRTYLADDGSLVLLVDGLPQLFGLPSLLDLEGASPRQLSPSVRTLRRLLRSNVRGYRSTLESADFDDVTFYALWPTRERPESTFEIENSSASEWVLDTPPSGSMPLQVAHWLANRFDRYSALKHLYPGYLIVCSNGNRPVDNPIVDENCDQVLIRGRSRSVTADLQDGTLQRVRKIPNRRRDSPLIRRETSVLQELRSTDAPIVETLPSGTVTETRFGPVYTERPATGSPLADRIPSSVEGFRDALTIGLRWLRAFQETYRGERITITPAEISDDLSLERLGLSPPPIRDSVTMFTTPCHGDYLPENVYVDDGTVSEVLDWEYATLSGYPVTDLAYFSIWTAACALGGLRDGIERAFLEKTPYSAVLRDVVREYCDELGLSVRAFLRYLAYPWIRQQKIHYRIGTAASYTALPAGIVPYVRLFWNRMETLERLFL